MKKISALILSTLFLGTSPVLSYWGKTYVINAGEYRQYAQRSTCDFAKGLFGNSNFGNGVVDATEAAAVDGLKLFAVSKGMGLGPKCVAGAQGYLSRKVGSPIVEQLTGPMAQNAGMVMAVQAVDGKKGGATTWVNRAGFTSAAYLGSAISRRFLGDNKYVGGVGAATGAIAYKATEHQIENAGIDRDAKKLLKYTLAGTAGVALLYASKLSFGALLTGE